MFAWSRTFYAKKNGKFYCFERKKDRDDAVKRHSFEIVSAKEAYKHDCIKVYWREYEKHKFDILTVKQYNY